jgi:hypothetical protein
MTLTTPFANAPDVSSDDYLVIGVATCFRRDDSDLVMLKVVEPVPSAYLESLLQKIPTSYERLLAVQVKQVLEAPDVADLVGEPDVHFCENFSDRVIAAARTYHHQPQAQTRLPLGTVHTDLDYSVEKKRVLNVKNVVKVEDNVRQHAYTHKTL